MPQPSKNDTAAKAYREAEKRIVQAAREGVSTLILENLGLTSVPPEIGSLAKLTNLYLYCNQLTGLPNEIGALTQLTTLSISDNQLTALPPEIGSLRALTTPRRPGRRRISGHEAWWESGVRSHQPQSGLQRGAKRIGGIGFG